MSLEIRSLRNLVGWICEQIENRRPRWILTTGCVLRNISCRSAKNSLPLVRFFEKCRFRVSGFDRFSLDDAAPGEVKQKSPTYPDFAAASPFLAVSPPHLSPSRDCTACGSRHFAFRPLPCFRFPPPCALLLRGAFRFCSIRASRHDTPQIDV